MDSGAGQEPDPAALDRVRRDLAELGTDEASAPDVPPALVSREQSAVISQRGVGTPTSQTGAACVPSGKLLIATR